jgi:ketosteroid isomerase-like protein
MHPNEELIRRFYEARARGDDDSVRDLLSPQIVMHEPPNYGGFAGDHAGVEAVFREVFDRYDGYEDSALDLHDVLANDDHAVALVTWYAVRDGTRVDGHEIGLYHVRDGRIAEAWFYPDGDYRDFFA